MLTTNTPVNLDSLEIFGMGVDHAEGIAVTPDGVIYVGGEAGQIYRIVDDVPVEVANTGGFILGLACDADSRIYAIDNAHKCVWRYDPADGSIEKWLVGLDHRPLEVPNWGAFGPDGSYYLTDSGDWNACNGWIWVKRPGANLTVFSELATNFPNGCAVDPAGDRLYYVESSPRGAIAEMAINPDGTAGQRTELCDLGLAVPDGIAVAADGSLIIACYRPDLIYRWSADGGLEILAGDPQGVTLAAPTNAVFMGAGLDTLVVPNLGRWHLTRGKLGVSGAPLFYPSAAQLGS
ncbi:SMP-30/gluconolactonase/LRE family protein [Gemmatimonas sp.]|uniref:SMP-30/gluconolactonase/LRE family protein n=1 Tax=Gemmatimonas sp. TaxID=1962908 RepID=UPI0035655112